MCVRRCNWFNDRAIKLKMNLHNEMFWSNALICHRKHLFHQPATTHSLSSIATHQRTRSCHFRLFFSTKRGGGRYDVWKQRQRRNQRFFESWKWWWRGGWPILRQKMTIKIMFFLFYSFTKVKTFLIKCGMCLVQASATVVPEERGWSLFVSTVKILAWLRSQSSPATEARQVTPFPTKRTVSYY